MSPEKRLSAVTDMRAAQRQGRARALSQLEQVPGILPHDLATSFVRQPRDALADLPGRRERLLPELLGEQDNVGEIGRVTSDADLPSVDRTEGGTKHDAIRAPIA